MDYPTSATDRQLLGAALKGDLAQVLDCIPLASPTATYGPTGHTALHAAAAAGHQEVVEALLRNRWDKEARTTKGSTPLHLAARAGHTAVMDVLVQSGANVNAADLQGNAPIHAAAWKGSAAAVSLLVGAGAAADSLALGGNATALHIAVLHGDLAVMRVLLGSGASVIAHGSSGYTPLLMACKRSGVEVVRELLRGGAAPNLGNREGVAALHAAVVGNRGEVVRLLLDYGADVRAANDAGITPLRAAVSGKHLAVVRVLLAAGAGPGEVGPGGATALHESAATGDLPIMQELLAALPAGQATAIVNVASLGLTPLHLAVELGHTSCVEALLAAGADAGKLYGAQARDAAGRSLAGATALHRAVHLGREAAVPLLVTPANLSHLWAGRTPLMLAVLLDNAHMAQMLVAAGSPVGMPRQDVSHNMKLTPMQLTAFRSNAAVRSLLPAMVRKECKLYLQQQQQQQQQQQLQQGGQTVAALLASVACSVCIWLAATERAGSAWFPEQSIGMSCFTTVKEMLGPAAAHSLLQQVLSPLTRANAAAQKYVSGSSMQLLKVLHSGWLAALDPLLRVRQRWANRLYYLVTQPLLQQGRGAGSAAAAGHLQEQLPVADAAAVELEAQATAAAAAGNWRLFVQVLEQLTGLQPDCANTLLYAVAAKQVSQQPISAAFAGLCEALLGAWLDARQQAARRAKQEAADAVVSAVQAWQGSRLQLRSRRLLGRAQLSQAGRAVQAQAAAGAAAVEAAACALGSTLQARLQHLVVAAVDGVRQGVRQRLQGVAGGERERELRSGWPRGA